MTRPFASLLAIGAALTTVLGAGAAMAQSRTWIAEGLGGEIAARDCAGDCGDDIGIIIACQGEGSNAAVSVPFAASNEPPAGSTEISFRLDGDSYTYEADTEEQGAVGFVPTFALRPNDPLIAALQSAGEARVSFEGRETRIGLRGSRSALDIFIAHCGWSGIPFDPTPVTAAATDEPAAPLIDLGGATKPLIILGDTTPKLPQFDGLHWFTNAYTDDTGADVIALIFGIPESDAILVATTCSPGTGARTVDVDLIVDPGGALPGEPVEAVFRVAGQAHTYPGQVFEDSSEYAGVRVSIGSRAPLWAALRAGGEVSVGIEGGSFASASADGAATAVPTFTDGCFKATAASGPLVKLDFGGNAEAGATVGEPLVRLDFGGIQVDGTAAPAVAAPLVDFGAVTPATGASANPAGGILNIAPPGYLCDDGTRLDFRIEVASAGDIARLELPGQVVSLPEIEAPFGRKFSDGTVTLHVSDGATIQVSQPSGRQLCQTQ